MKIMILKRSHYFDDFSLRYVFTLMANICFYISKGIRRHFVALLINQILIMVMEIPIYVTW